MLHQLIEKYFDGSTTLEEERELRRLLASDAYQGADVDEARAVMGIFATMRNKRRRAAAHRRYATIARAACLGTLIVGGSLLLMRPQAEEQDYLAYINGEEVSQERALQQMYSDLQLFSETSEDVSETIADDFQLMKTIFK